MKPFWLVRLCRRLRDCLLVRLFKFASAPPPGGVAAAGLVATWSLVDRLMDWVEETADARTIAKPLTRDQAQGYQAFLSALQLLPAEFYVVGHEGSMMPLEVLIEHGDIRHAYYLGITVGNRSSEILVRDYDTDRVRPWADLLDQVTADILAMNGSPRAQLVNAG